MKKAASLNRALTQLDKLFKFEVVTANCDASLKTENTKNVRVKHK